MKENQLQTLHDMHVLFFRNLYILQYEKSRGSLRSMIIYDRRCLRLLMQIRKCAKITGHGLIQQQLFMEGEKRAPLKLYSASMRETGSECRCQSHAGQPDSP